jgi:hypothetical protein
MAPTTGFVKKSSLRERTQEAALLRGRSAAKQRSSALRHKGERPFRALRPRRSAALLTGSKSTREFLHKPGALHGPPALDILLECPRRFA